MGKPSIFSNNYAKKMRKRKMRYVIIIIIIIIAILFAIFFSSNIKNVGSIISDSKPKNTTINNKDNKPASNKNKTSNAVTKIETKAEEEKSYTADLSSGKQIKLVYEEKDNNKTFKYVSPIDSGVITDISPSKKAIIILDSNQNILYYNIEGKKYDLTKKEYTSSDGTVFAKEDGLNKNPNYTWHGSPKFLNEENIAYISELPWFNKTIKYVWVVNVKSGKHVQLSEKLSGENLNFGELNEKGLIIKTSDKTYYLGSDGNSTE